MATSGTRIRGIDDNKMTAILDEIVEHLNSIAGVEPIWKRGIFHTGGPHYRIKGMVGPASIGEDECVVFGRLIEEFKPANCFIIGNAFGLSSTFIAKMMEQHGGQSVITLDSKSGGDGERCFSAAESLRLALNCRLLTNKVGWSPQDNHAAAGPGPYDLIFIDGNHSHPQVTRDFEGVQQLTHDQTMIVWHDAIIRGVRKSIEAAQAAGYHCLKINTSAEMVVGTRSQAVFERLRPLYANAEQFQMRRPPTEYLKIAYVTLIIGLAILRYKLRRARVGSRS
jgi:predicted O-methyltransferase YrrM